MKTTTKAAIINRHCYTVFTAAMFQSLQIEFKLKHGR